MGLMRTCFSIFSHHKRIFILLTVTFTFLFLGINLLLVPTPTVSHVSYTPHTQFCAPNPLDPDQAALGHVWLTASNLPFLMDELMRINHSVRNELVELDQRRRSLLVGVTTAQTQVEHIRSLLYEHSRQFMRLRATLHSYELALRDKQVTEINTRHNSWPVVQTQDDPDQPVPVRSIHSKMCTLDSCLNWNQCPVTSFLRVCRPHIDPATGTHEWIRDLTRSVHFLSSCSDPHNSPCLHLAFTLSEAHACVSNSIQPNSPTCLVILTEPAWIEALTRQTSNPGHPFILAAPYFPSDYHFRPGFDIPIPVPVGQLERAFELNTGLPPRLLPATRPILLGFAAGRVPNTSSTVLTTSSDVFENAFKQALGKLASASMTNRLLIRETQSELAACWPTGIRQAFSNQMFRERDWFPCHDSAQILLNSTFGLVLHQDPSSAPDVPASMGWSVQLILSLATGAIPVLVGTAPFPFVEAIPSELWSRAVLRVPRARISELTTILQSVPEHHRVEMRRQGQIIYRRHFQGHTEQINSLLLALSRRIGLPQPPVPTWPAQPAFAQSEFTPPKYYQVPQESTYQTDLDDFLGPVGPTHASPRFRANFTEPGGAAHLGLVATDDADRIVYPFWSYPSTPWDVPMPSDAAYSSYVQARHGLRPINHTINLAGFEFNRDLGGMFPYEQFTILMLTYDRFEIACKTLEGLLNLPYLHSVVVVWNHPAAPRADLAWPQLHVPIKVIHMSNNSLNNRFLPHDLIETDCILSVDDDIQLRHDEIIFGFRIWRENRDRLVGFPARAHFWNSTAHEWYYNSDYTCEFSMVLTGASFFHKYYSYAYTWEMPYHIRAMVDRFFNCEDLAMNFLVAHLTRKPPIKATIHWSFTCPFCTNTLHDQSGHYATRSKCLNQLTAWYGYNPLLYSQYRADSLLFKTRIPSTKQKCYKFI